jgi:hypothetical protein
MLVPPEEIISNQKIDEVFKALFSIYTIRNMLKEENNTVYRKYYY